MLRVVCLADEQMTHKLQNNNTKEILAPLRKFWDPHWISQPGDLAKGPRNPREFDIGDQWDFITEFTQDWGNRLLEGTNKTMCAQGPRRKEQWPYKRLTQSCLRVSRSLWWRHRSAVACFRVGGTECSSASMGPFEGGRYYLHYLHHSLVSDQTGREYSPFHQQKIGLKIYWAWPRPLDQDPVSPIRKLP